MPQGVGYGAILRGPDGQPAIDHVTGQPLTMEELIRRQGIIPWYERVTPTGQSAPTSVEALPIPSAGGTSVPFPARVPQGPSRPTGGAPVETTPGAPPSLDDAITLADDPEVQQAVAALEPQEQNQFWQMVMAGVGAAAVGAWLTNRLTRKGLRAPAAAQQAAVKPINVPIPSAGSKYIAGPATPANVKPVLNRVIPPTPLADNPVARPSMPAPATPIQPVPLAPPKANDMAGPPLDEGVKRTVERKVPARNRAIRALARARR